MLFVRACPSEGKLPVLIETREPIGVPLKTHDNLQAISEAEQLCTRQAEQPSCDCLRNLELRRGSQATGLCPDLLHFAVADSNV